MQKLDLSGFNGTANYYRVFRTLVTDGVWYLMENGLSWFVTDSLISIYAKGLKEQEFLSVHLKVKADKSAVVTIEDGNGKVFYRQGYYLTDCQQDITLFYRDDVLMLAQEY